MEQKDAKEITKLQELAYEIRVEEAMVKEVITISPSATMTDLREILRANRISGTPVIEDGRIIGIISVEDLIEALAAGEMKATAIEKKSERKYGLPVLYLTQVLGLSMGMEPADVGVKQNRVKPKALLKQLGL